MCGETRMQGSWRSLGPVTAPGLLDRQPKTVRADKDCDRPVQALRTGTGSCVDPTSFRSGRIDGYIDQDSRALALSAPMDGDVRYNRGSGSALFCSDCEQFFNGLDHPFFRFWTSPGQFPAVVSQPFLRVRGVDYRTRGSSCCQCCGAPMSRAARLFPPWSSAPTLIGSGTSCDPLGGKAWAMTIRSTVTCSATQIPVESLRRRCSHRSGREPKDRGTTEWPFWGALRKVFVSSQRPPLPESCMLNPNGTIVMPIVGFREFPAIRELLKSHAGR